MRQGTKRRKGRRGVGRAERIREKSWKGKALVYGGDNRDGERNI
jgi:hypothetical protein